MKTRCRGRDAALSFSDGAAKAALSICGDEMSVRKTKGRPKAAQSKTHTQHSSGKASRTQRSPDNWLLDAACYWRDGDSEQARRAARQGIAAMEVDDE